jgi:hypothetical protein
MLDFLANGAKPLYDSVYLCVEPDYFRDNFRSILFVKRLPIDNKPKVLREGRMPCREISPLSSRYDHRCVQLRNVFARYAVQNHVNVRRSTKAFDFQCTVIVNESVR